MFNIKPRYFWAFAFLSALIFGLLFIALRQNTVTDSSNSVGSRFNQFFNWVTGGTETATASKPKALSQETLQAAANTIGAINSQDKSYTAKLKLSFNERFPPPHKRPIEELVGKEISQIEDKLFARVRELHANKQLGEAYRNLLPKAQAGNPDAMLELADVIALCDSPVWRNGKDSPRLRQCQGVPENSQAEALRWLALAAREGNLLAQNRLLYLSTGGPEATIPYMVLLATDPVLNGLVQQEILDSLNLFTSIPRGGYLEVGNSVYTNGLVPKNAELAAAYSLASYSLQASKFPDAEITEYKGSYVVSVMDSISAAQQLAAIAKAGEILKRCCNGVVPAVNYVKYRKP